MRFYNYVKKCSMQLTMVNTHNVSMQRDELREIMSNLNIKSENMAIGNFTTTLKNKSKSFIVLWFS